MWVPPEEIDPLLLHEPTRKSIASFGAERPNDGLLITQRLKNSMLKRFKNSYHYLFTENERGERFLLLPIMPAGIMQRHWHLGCTGTERPFV